MIMSVLPLYFVSALNSLFSNSFTIWAALTAIAPASGSGSGAGLGGLGVASR